MSIRRVLVEHWSAPEADSGTVTAHIGYGSVLTGSTLDRGVDGTGDVRLIIPANDPAASGIAMRQIIRIEDPVAGTFEYRISQIDRQESTDPSTVTVTALPLILDLADCGYCFDDSSGIRDYAIGELTLTPTEWIDTWILGSLTTMGETHWARGTVNFTDDVTINCTNLTPLALLRALENATGGEVHLTRNGSTSIKIDLVTAIGSGSATPLMSVGRNLSRLDDSQQQQKMATVVVAVRGIPDGAITAEGIDQFVARVGTVVSGTVISIADPESSANLIRVDDQYNGWFAVRPDTGALVAISDSVASTQRLTLTASTGFVANDIIEFRANASGDRIAEVRHPANLALYGRRVLTLSRDDTGGRNYAPDPGLTDWTPSAEWEAVRCFLDSGAGGLNGTTDVVYLQGLPASFPIPDGTVGFIHAPSVGNYSFIADGSQAADGSGDVALDIINTTSTYTAADREVTLFLNQVPGTSDWPDNYDWHVDAGTTINPASDSQAHAFGMLCREPVAGVSATCQTDGIYDPAVNANTTISLKNLAAGYKVYPGDYVTNTGGTVFWGVCLENATADGSGDVSVGFGPWAPSTTIADSTDLYLIRPSNCDSSVTISNANRILLGPPARVIRPRIISPEAYVRVESGWILRGQVKYAYTNVNNSSVTPAYQANLAIIDSGWNIENSVTDTGRVFGAASETSVIQMTTDYAAPASDTYRVSFLPPSLGNGVGNYYWAQGYWSLMDLSLSYSPQGYDMTGVAYSSANAAFQAANRALVQYGELPRSFSITLRDLAYDDRFVMADEKLTLGGNVRLLSTALDIDQQARIVRIVYDLTDPMSSQVTLDTEPLRITEAV